MASIGTVLAPKSAMNTFPADVVQKILADTKRTRHEKVEQLRQLDYELRETLVAAEEGMTRTTEPAPNLEVVQRALRSLGAAADVGGASKH